MSENSQKVEHLKRCHAEEMSKLRDEMRRAADDYSDKINAMETLSSEQIQNMSSRHKAEIEVRISDCFCVRNVMLVS